MKQTSQSNVSRRKFIHGATAVAAATTLPTLAPPSVLGANEKIVMGIIGPGGRGRGVMRDFIGLGATFTAVCDAYSVNRERGMELAADGAKGYTDYRKLLENKDIDAVLIGTPEHQHGVQLMDSVAAGKDAYCEKPMSHSIEEGHQMVQAVRATDRIVQVGMQRRSSPAVHKAKEMVSKCGAIHMVKAKWNWNTSSPMRYGPVDGELDWQAFCHPGPVAPFQVMRFRNWRVFWDYSGGHCCDQGTHLMDVVQWFMDSGTPSSADCFGRVYKMDGAETPDVFTAGFEYETFNATWSLCYTNRYMDGWTITFLGDQGTLVLDGWGSRFFADDGRGEGKPAPYRKPDWEFSGPLPTTPHVENFLECIKSRKEPNAPVEVGHAAVCGPHLANVAWHAKQRAYLSPHADKASTDPRRVGY